MTESQNDNTFWYSTASALSAMSFSTSSSEVSELIPDSRQTDRHTHTHAHSHTHPLSHHSMNKTHGERKKSKTRFYVRWRTSFPCLRASKICFCMAANSIELTSSSRLSIWASVLSNNCSWYFFFFSANNALCVVCGVYEWARTIQYHTMRMEMEIRKSESRVPAFVALF